LNIKKALYDTGLNGILDLSVAGKVCNTVRLKTKQQQKWVAEVE